MEELKSRKRESRRRWSHLWFLKSPLLLQLCLCLPALHLIPINIGIQEGVAVLQALTYKVSIDVLLSLPSHPLSSKKNQWKECSWAGFHNKEKRRILPSRCLLSCSLGLCTVVWREREGGKAGVVSFSLRLLWLCLVESRFQLSD